MEFVRRAKGEKSLNLYARKQNRIYPYNLLRSIVLTLYHMSLNILIRRSIPNTNLIIIVSVHGKKIYVKS